MSIHTDDDTAYAAEQVAAERKRAFATLARTLTDINARNPDFNDLRDNWSDLTMEELIREAKERSLCSVSSRQIEIFADNHVGLEYTPSVPVAAE